MDALETATEDGLAPPGKHPLSLSVQYASYDVAEGTWDERRDANGTNIVETFAEYAPNPPGTIEHMRVLGPPMGTTIASCSSDNTGVVAAVPGRLWFDVHMHGYGKHLSNLGSADIARREGRDALRYVHDGIYQTG